MIQLSPSEFTFGKYGRMNLSWKILGSTESYLTWLLAQNIIGYCKSIECEIRPRKDEMAVMFEIDDWQSWVHIPMEVWKEHLKLSKQ